VAGSFDAVKPLNGGVGPDAGMSAELGKPRLLAPRAAAALVGMWCRTGRVWCRGSESDRAGVMVRDFELTAAACVVAERDRK
jgi:hypothetical protein